MLATTDVEDRANGRSPCGVPILDQARDLGLVRDLPGDGFLKMNAFKFVTASLNAFKLIVQINRDGRRSARPRA